MGGNVVLKLSLVSRKRTFFARGNEIHYIGGTEILPAPLDAVEEQKMIHMLGTSAQEEARSKLIERNLRLVVYIAKKFDEPLNVDWDGNELLLSDILGTDDDIIYKDLEHEVDKKLLMRAMTTLTEREKMIIELRFGINQKEGEEKTQKEVADLLGISQSYISRLEKKIIKRLKKEMIKMGCV